MPASAVIAMTPGGVFVWDRADKKQSLLDQIKPFNDQVRSPRVSVDGVAIDPVPYLVETDFHKTVIEAPEFGPILGEVVFKSKAWMLVLRPLTKGKHTITIADELSQVDDKGLPVKKDGKLTFDTSTVTFTLKLNVVWQTNARTSPDQNIRPKNNKGCA